MRPLLLAGLVLLTAACGAYQFPGQSPEPSRSAHVSGVVLSVPCAPVEQEGVSCGGRPVGNVEIDYAVGSNVVAKTQTNADGAYAIDLAPGAYTVKFQTYMRLISGPTNLSLAAGSKTVANYTLDNGIRAPVPQE